MSGHSKWATIKRKKGAADAKRSKLFSRLSKEITIAVKIGGADPDSNPRLRLAITNAKANSVPKDNITRAVNKGTDKDAASLQEVTYEGYLPNGIAVYVECTTDNLKRTIANVRAIFSKHGGNLSTNGSLSFMFETKGIFTVPQEGIDQDEFEMEVIDAGAEDISMEDEFFIITTSLEDFGSMVKKLEALNIEAKSAEIERIPNETKELDLEKSKKILKALDAFEDEDDVQNIFHNLELTEELANEL
ncbi:MAG: YebC/PmpR family DNA-binding transcriptional regulator [Hyphomicrobiales bacterium]